VQRWLRVGVAAWESDRLLVAPDALDRWPAAGPEESRFERLLSELAARPSTALVVAIAEEAVHRAMTLLQGGRLDKSIDRLHEALLIVRRHAGRAARPAPALRRAEERLLSVWLDLALADGTAFVVSRARHELSRAGARTAAIERLDQLAEATLAFAAGGDRALRMLDAMPPFEEVALERRRQGLRALAARRCSHEIEDAVIEEVTRWARGVGDAITLARLTFWRGWWHYRRGRYADAARSHMEAAAREPWRVARTSAELAAASALLETFDFAGAAAMVSAAQSGARTLGSPLIEARAEWLSRAVTYRSGEDREPDVDLLQALEHLDARDILATAHLTEAAFAYRRGREDTAARLAQRAADLWRSLGDHPSHLIARCLSLACGAGPPASGEPADLAAQSVRCPVPGIGIQALGLLASACPEAVAARARAEDVVALAELVPPEFRRLRMDILSAEEGAALARAALQASTVVKA
jgi:eukaryotic-like serine/threonine-protein kinase